MQSGAANLFSGEFTLQGNAQCQGRGAILVNGAANAEAHARQNIVLVITLTIAIHMTIIKEGERVGVAINHRHCIFSAKGEAAVATQIVFLVAADAVHAAHVELTGANHVVATAPLCIRTQIPHLACLIQLLVHAVEFVEAKVLAAIGEHIWCTLTIATHIAVLLVEDMAGTIVGHGKAQGEILHGVIHHTKSFP